MSCDIFLWPTSLRSSLFLNKETEEWNSRARSHTLSDEAGVWATARRLWVGDCTSGPQIHVIGSGRLCTSGSLQMDVLSVLQPSGHSRCSGSVAASLLNLSMWLHPLYWFCGPPTPTLWMALTLNIGKSETEWGRFWEKQQKWFRKERGWCMWKDKKRYIYLTGLGDS